MAANKTSRPSRNPEDMLVGLDNINGIKKEQPNVEHKIIVEPEPISNPIPTVREAVKAESVATETKPIRKPGRPRKFKENDKTEVIGVRLLENEVRFLEKYGGEFGGKTGYVTYLVREEMKKRGVNEK